jgi:hypothetical protein
MGNKELLEVVQVLGEKGFTVVEIKQELRNGRAGLLADNGKGPVGTVVIRMVPATVPEKAKE